MGPKDVRQPGVWLCKRDPYGSVAESGHLHVSQTWAPAPRLPPCGPLSLYKLGITTIPGRGAWGSMR